MKFTSKADDTRWIPALNTSVAPGDEISLTADEAHGFLFQCIGPDAWLKPSDEDAEAAVQSAKDAAVAVLDEVVADDRAHRGTPVKAAAKKAPAKKASK